MQAEESAKDAEGYALVALQDAELFVIDCMELAQMAGSKLQEVVALRKAAEEQRKEITRPMDEAKKAVMKLFEPAMNTLERAESILRLKMSGWAKRERDRLEAERKEAERLANIEAAKRLEEARQARLQGQEDQAIAKEQEAAQLPSIAVNSVAKTEAKIQGISSMEVWKWECVDFAKLNDQFKTTDDAKITKVVKALKGDTQIPGIRVWPETSTVVRG